MNTKIKTPIIPSKMVQRILTASILALLIILSIFVLPHILFILIVTFIFAIAGWEWCRLIGIKHNLYQTIYILVLVGVLCLARIFFPGFILVLAICWWLYAIYLMYQYPKKKSWLLDHQPTLVVVGFLLLIPCFVAIFIMRDLSPQLLLYGLFIVWGTDTGAFMLGRYFGKHKLAPNISPGKTIEGLIGGLLLAIIVAAIGAWLLRIPLNHWPNLLIIAILVSLASVIGDLFESMIKREAGVKDSGDWLPGHGGLLDRIDSLLCAIPVYTLGILFLS